MIVPKDEVRLILRGELDEVHLTVGKPPAVGSLQSVQSGVGKRAACTVRVVETWEHRHGGYVVRFELARAERAPRYLRRNGGYTTDPEYAMRDMEDRHLAEWSPPAGWKDPGTEARETHRLELEADQLERRLREVDSWDELVRLKMLARERGVDIRSDMRVIERRVDAIKEKIRTGRQAA